jgi:proline dehydrogenase
MLRRILLYLSTAGWARNIATHWGVARRVARRFVAGETLEEALAVAHTLNQQGIAVTLDFLGESVHAAADTIPVTATYQQLTDQIKARGLNASISLKLTHLGLDISEDLCMTNLRHILTRAQENGVPVTIDMENTPYTDITLRLFRTLFHDYGYSNVGTVIQAYLYRSEQDLQALAAEGAHIRLCKGAYLETPQHAFPEKKDVDANYVKLAQQYLNSNGSAYLCLATHDEAMITAAEAFIAEKQIPPQRYEFQMLYGIRSTRQLELAQKHTMRVYVPFGVTWYPYFVRRLAERPANVWFFVKNFFG